jgi:hypothetical protein
VVAVACVLLVLLGGWVMFVRQAGDEVILPSGTNAPTTGPVRPTTSSTAARSENVRKGDPRRILLPQLALSARVIPIAAQGRLVLVTCEDWNGKVYLSNTVVIAVPEGSGAGSG